MIFFYDWFEGRLDLDSDLQFIDESLDQSPKSDDGEWMQVRVAQNGELSASSGQETFLILDSGSDVSLLPRDYLPDVSTGSGHKLRDCQGNSLGVAGTKKAEILVKDSADDEIVFRQNFLISNVTNAILSLGALLQKGWNLQRADGDRMMLVSPDGTLSIPTYYRGSSLAIDCQIRCVQEEQQEGPQPESVEADEAIVRVVARTNAEFLLTTYNEWFLTSDNTPYILHRGRNFADVRMMWGNYWPYRSTLIKEVHSSGPWQVVE